MRRRPLSKSLLMSFYTLCDDLGYGDVYAIDSSGRL